MGAAILGYDQAMGAIGTEFKRGWTVVLACTVGFALGGSGIIFYTAGVFADALRSEFHWTMSALQSGSLIMAAFALVTTPLTGWLADRIGSRRIAIPSMIAFGLCFAALSRQDGHYSTYALLWSLLALANAGTQSIVWSRTVAAWFAAGRGLALGITLVGTGITSFAAPPLAGYLIREGGWRFAYMFLGSGALLVATPILILFLRDPTRRPSETGPSGSPLGSGTETAGFPIGAALRDRRFWILFFCLLCVTFTVSGFIANFVRISIDHGFSRIDAVWFASATGVMVIVGRLTCGYLLDRLHGPIVGAACFVGLPIACSLMAAPEVGPWTATCAAALVGVGAAAEFDVFPYLVSRYFGVRRLGSVLGFVTLAFQLGSGFGPIAFARVFDATGSYRPMLLAMAGLSLLGGLSLLSLGAYPGAGDPAESVERQGPRKQAESPA
jgi:MFS family permease